MTHPQLKMTAPPEVYRRRRANLAAALRRPIVLFAGRTRPRQHATNTYPFRASSSYLYFGGIRIEDTVHVRASSATSPDIFTGDLPSDPDAVTAVVTEN